MVNRKPIVLGIAPMNGGTVASADLPLEKSMSDVVSDDMIENDIKADLNIAGG